MILCSGSIIYDTLVWPVDEARWGTTTFVETIECHPGGNGANTSLALAIIGTPVRLLGTIGDDDQGSFVSAALGRAGVDTSGIAITDAPTAATIAIVNRSGGRKFLHRLGASACAFTSPIDFTPGITDGMRHYHMASLFILPRLRPHAAETLRRARAVGLTTSLDTNWDPEGVWMRDLEPCLRHLDMIFINEDEAEMCTGAQVPAIAAARLLKGGARSAVMKLGARGCAIYTGDRETVCPAFEVEAKDTTGAGDCFVAGFLSARLRGASRAEAGNFANAVGALCVQRVGGAAGVLNYDETQSWMRTARLRK